MRFHNQLDDILGNTIRLRLLRILVRTGNRGLTGRELAKVCGASASQVTSSLQALESSGVVVREIVGHAHLWRMAEGHVMAPVLTALFRAEAGSLTTLKNDLQAIIRNLPVERATLFGSVARGDERATSDIDLWVQVRSRADKKRVEEALSGASLDFAIKFGNPLSALVVEERQLRTPTNPALLATIRQDGIDLGTAE
jgi:DNA-binding Lrp family transcriptional regulator